MRSGAIDKLRGESWDEVVLDRRVGGWAIEERISKRVCLRRSERRVEVGSCDSVSKRRINIP